MLLFLTTPPRWTEPTEPKQPTLRTRIHRTRIRIRIRGRAWQTRRGGGGAGRTPVGA
ncbi:MULTISPECIES: hypothetical protein [Streptomyces]|uniref:Uncharacterized protein n=1 Tax=Streptomyces ehimensis TaxID=68195 RepID=A0ABV9BUB3_9ACTN